MSRVFDPRRTLYLSVILLALFVLGLSGGWAWHGYTEYRKARRMLAANEIVDYTLRAAGILAVERGLTSVALGVGFSAADTLELKIAALRRSGDELWELAVDGAERLAAERPDNPLLAEQIENSAAAYQQLVQARARVDRTLQGGPREIDGPEWIALITRLITTTAGLRNTVLAAVDLPGEIARFNLSLKNAVWMAGEHAGRERGILAFYIGAGLPVPAATLEELASYRSIVQANLGEIRALRHEPGVDARVRRAITAMEDGFLGQYEVVRRVVYAKVAGGDYPLTGTEWMEKSTRAINTILAVASAATTISAAHADGVAARTRGQLLLHLLLLAATATLVIFNVRKVRQITNQLFQQKELAEVTLHSIGDAVITTDARARVEYLNPVAEEITGWSTSRARGRPLAEVIRIVNGLTGEAEPNPVERCLQEERVVGLDFHSILVRPDGKEIAIDDSAAPIRDRDGRIVGAVMVFYDVTSMRSASHLLAYHATHDPLTKLLNRREFERRLDELLKQAQGGGQHHALAYFDLDQFKLINDTCGHRAGDKLLRQLGFVLREAVREGDTLARLGGDEFGLLLADCGVEQALRTVEELRQRVRDFPFGWEGRTFDISVSVGLVPITPDSPSAAEILSAADAACFAAKDEGRNCIQVYERENTELTRRHGEMRWVARIREALRDDRFVLHCQPIVPLSGTEGRHCEVLIRMIDEAGQLVPPMTFIPAAERYDLMPEIDRWVVRNALHALGRVFAQSTDARFLCSINLSGLSLGPAFQEFIFEQLMLCGVPPHVVCLEITETAAVANFDQALAFINALRSRGCRFALDDFGSGLSSFVYLKNLPVDYLKIDGSLIKGIAEDPATFGMVQAIQKVASLMGLRTIAEFVGDAQTVDKLRELGVDYAQGYHIARPAPLPAFLAEAGASEREVAG